MTTSHLQKTEKGSVRKLHVSRSSFPSRRTRRIEARDARGRDDGDHPTQANVSVLATGGRKKERRAGDESRSGGFNATPTRRGGVLSTRVNPRVSSTTAIRLFDFPVPVLS